MREGFPASVRHAGGFFRFAAAWYEIVYGKKGINVFDGCFDK